MNITTQRLTAVSGLCAAAAGAIFIGVQINHPHLDATSIQTTEMAIRDSLKVLMAVLALVGISGMYLSQVRRNGLLGLIGYLVFGAGYLMILSTAYVAAYVTPSVAAADPHLANGLIKVAIGDSTTVDVGAFATMVHLQGFAFLGGSLLFGIALFRAGVLARWATLLLAAGGLITVALTLMPDAFYRLLAFPNGIAMIGLGISLWRTQRSAPAVETSPASVDVAAVR